MKNLQLKDSDWLHLAGSAVCFLSVIAGFGFFLLEEQPSRLRFEKEAEQSGETSNSQIVPHRFDKAMRVLGMAVIWVVGAGLSSLGSLIGFWRKHSEKKIRDATWLCNLASLVAGVGLAMVR